MRGQGDYAPPSFDEVMKYAVETGLKSKICVSKFYDYYSKQKFLYKGLPMNWKERMSKWAENERGEKSVLSQMQDCGKQKFKPMTSEEWEALQREMEGWGK